MKLQSIVVALAAGMLLTVQSVGLASGARVFAAAPAASPRALCLTVGDVNRTLGGTFRAMPGTSIGNMGPGILSLQAVKKAGLVKGYGVTYARQNPGETLVISGVNLFRSTAFARSGVDRVVRAYGTAGSRSAGVRATVSHDLGDSAAIVTFRENIGHGAVFHGLGIIFSQGVYAADVMVYSTSAVDRGKVLALAASVDNRIRKS